MDLFLTDYILKYYEAVGPDIRSWDDAGRSMFFICTKDIS